MVQQGGRVAAVVVLVVVLTASAVIFAALTPVEAAARRVLYDPADQQTPQVDVAEAPGPVAEFPDCHISEDCSYTFATSMATNVTINDVNCCNSIIRNGKECFVLALYYSDLGKPDFVKTDIFQWGYLVWDHCLSIA